MGDARNYFELFGLPVRFELDTAELQHRYRALQRAAHPDRHAGASDRERRLAMEQAALINAAYQTLKSPLARARYLLELEGVRFDDERDTHLDPAFLVEQMELREALAAAREAADPLAEVLRLGGDIERRRRALIEELGRLLAAGDRDAARGMVHKLQFLERLREEAEQLEEELSL